MMKEIKKVKKSVPAQTESRYVIYHKAKDLQKMGYKLSGRKKDIKGFTYLEVEGLQVLK
jgi:hypothetical protein